jgi:protein O-GlcNAc transferase
MNTIGLLSSAVSLHQKGELANAEKIYYSVLEHDPNNPDALHLLGVIARQRGNIDAAIEYFEKACKAQESNRLFLSDFADSLHEKGFFEKALEYHKKASEIAPESPITFFKMAKLLYLLNKNETALQYLQRTLQLDPHHFEAAYNCAQIFYKQGNAGEALSFVQKAISLKPGFAHANNLAGLISERLGNIEGARLFYLEAIRLKQDYAEARNNLGSLLFSNGDLASAVSLFTSALRIQPDFFEAQYNLGNCMRETKNLDEAITCFRKALNVRPDSIRAMANLGEALQTIGNIVDAERWFNKAASKAKPEAEELYRIYSNVLLCSNYNPDYSPQKIYEMHKDIGGRFSQSSPEANYFSGNQPQGKVQNEIMDAWRNSPNGKKLRIGFCSADFCNHPAARFLEPVFLHFDRNSFEFFCYSDVSNPDEVTTRLKSFGIHWRNIYGLNDCDVFNCIRDDAIDVLVDCGGHTANNRLPLFAKKPAPLLVSYLGYPCTTGIATMDYNFTDAFLDPAGEDCLYTEKLLRLPDCFCSYLPPPDAPEISELPALRNGFITFGSFHPLMRLHNGVISLWCDVLRKIPLSRLLIVRTTLVGSVKKRLETMFFENGIDPSRIDLRHEIPTKGHLALYGDIDISLDTFPWSGHTTACESLLMGVPVISLYGNRHAGRMVASILKHSGLNDWVAFSKEEYCSIAQAKSGRLDDLATLHCRLREAFASSPVCNGGKFTGTLEEAFKKIWMRFCKNPAASETRASGLNGG